jgi:hypothetical protein
VIKKLERFKPAAQLLPFTIFVAMKLKFYFAIYVHAINNMRTNAANSLYIRKINVAKFSRILIYFVGDCAGTYHG